MKILYVATVGSTMCFFTFLIHEFIKEGNIVDIATNEKDAPVPECYKEWGCKVYPISCTRSLLCSGNLKAIKQLKRLITRNNYDIVHCHTPIAAVCTRVACRGLRKNGLKVVYTAHGFHFYKGAPMKNWLLYYPVEKFLSHWTDCLITINKEDYQRAKRKFHAKQTEYVPGVGIDLEKFHPEQGNVRKKRESLGVTENDVILLSVGELNRNKNHSTVIKAVAGLEDPSIHYIIAGQGELKRTLENLAEELGIAGQVHLLGFRKDIADIMKVVDIYCLPSLREGLNVSLMEAMASGLPCAVSRIRGNVDLIDERNGVLFDPKSVESIKEALLKLQEKDIENMVLYNASKLKYFCSESVTKNMINLYDFLQDNINY